MVSQIEVKNMALFCDFENIAIGVKDSQLAKFDIQKVLERLLLKGSIVVKKAYCDWERFKEFKAVMHEALSSSSKSPMSVSRARIRPTSAWWSMLWTCVIPRATWRPLLLSAETQIFRLW